MTSSAHAETAVRFLQLAASGQVDAAFARVTPDFRHHNPHSPSDAASLKAGMGEAARMFPGTVLEVQQVIAEGDRVAVHSRIRLGGAGPVLAVVHLLRFEGDRIAEFWDIAQPVPEAMPNERGMF